MVTMRSKEADIREEGGIVKQRDRAREGEWKEGNAKNSWRAGGGGGGEGGGRGGGGGRFIKTVFGCKIT